jgi:pleiotropic regulator 1
MRFWDYTTGYCFQEEVTKAQPGSLDSEAGIYASTFDKTGLYVLLRNFCHFVGRWLKS